MESWHHDLGSINHARLLTAGYMDPQTTGQMRPPYTDLCRPPATDASTLSAYHSRYLPSMPISTGSSFPFLGGMFTGSLPGPPTSPFRTPSTPGVNNMRQFWPPTPPPDGGYGRLALNTNLFPLFGASPDSGAFLTQGLVSRLGSTTHLPLIDHKEHSFFSHGIGLGTPLTPNSHVASPSPFPHLIPSLERHPVYGGHMTLGNKELEDLQHEADDGRLMKSHLDCLMKHDIPSSRLKSKHDGKNCCDKTVDDCCKLSQSCMPSDNGKSHDDIASKKQLTNKVQPCKIEVSHSPTIKPDLLSPPIDSPKSDVPSPNRSFKKTSHSPFAMEPVTRASYEEKSETRCSQCCANIKDVGVATKLGASEIKENSAPVIVTQPASNVVIPQNSHAPVVSSVPTPVSTSNNASHQTNAEGGKLTYENEPSSSPVIAVKGVSDKQSFCKSNTTEEEEEEDGDSRNNNNTELPLCKSNNVNVTTKHVTAAVIPTAPKQMIHRDIHPEINSSKSVHESLKSVTSSCDSSVFVKEQKGFCTDHCVKVELDTSNEKALPNPNNLLNNTFNNNRPFNKNLATSCKVKDMIKNVCTVKQVQPNSLLKNSENFEATKTPPESPSPKAVSSSAVSLTVSPNIMSKSPNKNIVKMQYVPMDNVRKCSPFKEDVPIMKNESANSRLDCEFSQKTNAKWTKATVSPFTWQGNNNNNINSQDDQAMNLTVSKKTVKPEPNETAAVSESSDNLQDNLKNTSENVCTSSSNVIGVCHPNPIVMNKMKNTSAVSSVNNFASISVLNQPATEQSTEVHILHRSSKSSFPVVNRNGASPVPLKSTISHVTANTSIHRSLKTERLMTKRGKISEMDKLSHTGRTTLATLAPKLSKNVNFGKDMQSSHTISTSSSVSSTSIVFPATVNPCIPVGIAIAQQRQDSSASIGKSQPSVPSSTPSALSTTSHLSTNHVAADIQTQEIIRDQKNQDIPISNNATPVDASLLVAQGPTIVSRQWESEALTRTAALPSSWVAHGSIVAPAVWLGQGAYTAPAAPATNTVPNVTMNSIESSPISLPPGGYQLARDSITGHLLLIPTANIELMDRPSVWPAFNSTAGNLPIQQLVTQQQHTQFEQVLPQPEPLKTADPSDNSCNITACDISSNTAVKTEEKIEDLGGQVPSVPLATGQTYAFTTFPTQCDPAGFSYVLQSSTVMHLAHTQTTASIQTESGRRSQATSPLHCATPSPPPNTCSVQVSVTEDDESENESDMECCESNQQHITTPTQSVTTAIQVDMDSQTNSEEDEDEEGKVTVVKSDTLKVEMSDSANQTESVPSESPKSEPETEDMEIMSDKLIVKEVNASQSSAKADTDLIPAISVKEDSAPVESGLEIVTSETELAPSLPVESKPVMDFIDHHGLNLLVDSIEEFASREQETQLIESTEKVEEPNLVNDENQNLNQKPKSEGIVPKSPEPQKFEQTVSSKSFSSNFKTLDTTVTDGLGLLCALAEQRFFEEALNDDSKVEEPKKESLKTETKKSVDSPCLREYSNQSSCDASSALSSICSSPSQREVSEMEMRLQIEELQKKYKQKQRELELLRKSKGIENNEEDLCNSYSQQKTFQTAPASSPQTLSESTYPVSQDLKFSSSESSLSDSNSFSNDSETNKKSVEEVGSDKSNIPTQNVQSVKPIHVSTKLSHSSNSNTNASDSSSGGCCSEVSSQSNETAKADNDNSLEKKTSFSCSEPTFEKNDKSKTPFFDEQAWFVRRSERIFLSEARTITTPTLTFNQDKSAKKTNGSLNKGSSDTNKEKKEHAVKLKHMKSLEETPVKKCRNKPLKPKTILSKKRLLSTSSDSDSSSDSESESSDAASCTSENIPLSTLVETSSSSKSSVLERQKRLSTDSEYSSGQSDDLPLSVLLEQKIPELKSCFLKPEDLQENARLLVLDEGLFYAGHITKSEDPDMYGILIDGDRAARPHMFSKEEILNAAVLEVKPSHKLQLPEGSRICAFWSQQYRCLYPGTVTKASSPLTDPSLLYVEFDDGDRGRIPLNDIRMLPSDFPIVSLEPNPFMILGKRRSRTQSQNNINGNSDCKSDTASNSSKVDRDKTEHKKQKTLDKISKKNSVDSKAGKEKVKSKSPSATSRSRSSSKSSVSGHSEAKPQNSANKKELSDEKKKSESKLKHSEKKSKDASDSDTKSILKPKKHKKHKEDHHKHHHHHHKHHHHKKHKAEKSDHSSTDTVIPSNKNQSTNKDSSNSSSNASEQEYDTFILENSKSDLTMKIKKSPSPHTNHEEKLHSKVSNAKKKLTPEFVSTSSSSDEDEEPPAKKQKKSKLVSPSKRKERVPSVEKSKIAAFLPDRQLWRWSGKSFRRPGAKGKAKKEFYRSIQRGKEAIKVGDCAVFLSTGRPHLPYIGRIETMWESWGGKMDVKVKWFYHPEETKSGKKLSQLKGALFQSPHFDENDVQTISHKCEVLSWSDYQQKNASESIEDNNDTYFLAGTYDPIMGTLILEPGVPNISSSNICEP